MVGRRRRHRLKQYNSAFSLLSEFSYPLPNEQIRPDSTCTFRSHRIPLRGNVLPYSMHCALETRKGTGPSCDTSSLCRCLPWPHRFPRSCAASQCKVACRLHYTSRYPAERSGNGVDVDMAKFCPVPRLHRRLRSDVPGVSAICNSSVSNMFRHLKTASNLVQSTYHAMELM